jgi:hypothetical protein
VPVWIAQRDGGILADPHPPIFAVAAEADIQLAPFGGRETK